LRGSRRSESGKIQTKICSEIEKIIVGKSIEKREELLFVARVFLCKSIFIFRFYLF
jgi:hypothetical protein